MANNKNKAVAWTEDYLADFLKNEGLELYDCQFVKEGRDWFLRVFIDFEEEGKYVGTDQCESVSRYLSQGLDEHDVIQPNYYLEVSSPGMDRQLTKDDHFKRYEGHLVVVKLYKAIDGQKTFTAVLKEKTDQALFIELEDGTVKEIPLNDVSKVNLEVVF